MSKQILHGTAARAKILSGIEQLATTVCSTLGPKGRNVGLSKKWVDGAIVIYIGQAGGKILGRWPDQTLKDRISMYMNFGKGHPVAKRGGRYIWQIKNYKNLIICWKPLPNKKEDPRQVEKQLICNFESVYKTLPFANLRR